MDELFEKYFNLKKDLRVLNRELKDKLLEDEEFEAFYEDYRASSEVMRSYKKKLIAEVPSLGAAQKKIKDKRDELKVVKKAIEGNVVHTIKDTGEQLSFAFSF